jgi:Sucrase/ferredoxin-like
MTALEPGERCAARARALDEPLPGTAPNAARWACLEHPDPWPRDLAQHTELEVRHFAERANAAGFRPLLIRRPGATSRGGPRLIYLADTDPARTAVTTRRVTELAELATLPLPARSAPLTGDPGPAALLLVCAAERDPCCGTDGQALVDALAGAGEPDVWACSHLGGHRFAPTALVLPTGYLYGYLDLASAVAARAAAAAGKVAIGYCRGRSTWSAAGQVAELAVRAAAEPLAADALTVREPSDGPIEVTARGGERWTVDVEPVELDALRPASCGARPTLMAPWRAAAVHAPPADDAHSS